MLFSHILLLHIFIVETVIYRCTELNVFGLPVANREGDLNSVFEPLVDVQSLSMKSITFLHILLLFVDCFLAFFSEVNSLVNLLIAVFLNSSYSDCDVLFVPVSDVLSSFTVHFFSFGLNSR